MTAASSTGVDIVRVERIDGSDVRPGLRSYTISANTTDKPARYVQYSTLNRFFVELCDWGRQCEWPLQITWKQTPYGRDVVLVEKGAPL